MISGRKAFIRTEIILGILVVIVLGFIVYNKINSGKEKIAVIVPNVDENQWSAFKYGLKMAAQEYDIDIVVISKEGMQTASDERAVIEQEIRKGADAVIIKPISDSDEGAKIKQITGKVPVMIVGDKLTDDGKSVFQTIEPDQYAMGVDLAKQLLENNNGNLVGKTIGIYSEYEVSEAAAMRRKGVIDTLEGCGAQILWDVSKNSESNEEVNLQTQRKVDIVMALDNASLVEAGEAAANNNLYGALVYGIGNSSEAVYYLDTKWVQCLVVPDEFEAGYQSVTELVNRLRKRWHKIADKQVAYTVLTRDNLFSKENQYLLFTISQ